MEVEKGARSKIRIAGFPWIMPSRTLRRPPRSGGQLVRCGGNQSFRSCGNCTLVDHGFGFEGGYQSFGVRVEVSHLEEFLIYIGIVSGLDLSKKNTFDSTHTELDRRSGAAR